MFSETATPNENVTQLPRWIALFTSIGGRIDRKTWWLASIALLIGFLIAVYTTYAAVEPSLLDTPASLQQMLRLQWASLIIAALFALPTLALGLQRRHDRDNPGTDVIVFVGLSLLVRLPGAFGAAYMMTETGGVLFGLVMTVVSIVLDVYGLYLMVVLGFLPGTQGPNRYGPSPASSGLSQR